MVGEKTYSSNNFVSIGIPKLRIEYFTWSLTTKIDLKPRVNN